MKVVINRKDSGIYCWDIELLEYLIKKGWKHTSLSDDGKGTPKDKSAYIILNYANCLIDVEVNNQTLEDVLRTHKDFIEIVENNILHKYAHLSVIEIPDNIEYYIDSSEYGECVHEKHRIWN